MPTPLLAALVLLSLTLATPEGTVQPVPAYRRLVDAYRSHGPAEVEQVGNVPHDAMEAAVDAAVARDSGWTWEEVRGAAMLHSEVALRALRSNDTPGAEAHVRLAERLLNRTVSLSPPQEDFAWRWYIAMSQTLQLSGGRVIALRLDAAAEKRWEHDAARQAFRRGLALERRGARVPREYSLGERRGSMPATLGGNWAAAARLFAEALRQDPSLRAAALHLGRLRMLQGERSEAATLFRTALADVNPAVAYLADVFLGSLEEREGRFDAAERFYRSAVARIPHGQAAPLALSQLFTRTGREPEARQTLATHVLRPGAALVEPMWVFFGPGESPGTEIDLLRLEVWK